MGEGVQYFINYIWEKLQEGMGNIFILCSLSWKINKLSVF
jgi:hypothetical protein